MESQSQDTDGSDSASEIPSSITLEKLLNVDSLDDEGCVVAALQDCYRYCWSEESRHMFCTKLPLVRLKNGVALEGFSCEVYQFLYGFVYETQAELHQFMNDQVLSRCIECIIGYYTARHQFLQCISHVYDASSVENLDNEYIKWDIQRMSTGFNRITNTRTCLIRNGGPSGCEATDATARLHTEKVSATSPYENTQHDGDAICYSFLEFLLEVDRLYEAKSERQADVQLLKTYIREDQWKPLVSRLAEIVGTCDPCLLKALICNVAHTDTDVSRLSYVIVARVMDRICSNVIGGASRISVSQFLSIIVKVFKLWERQILVSIANELDGVSGREDQHCEPATSPNDSSHFALLLHNDRFISAGLSIVRLLTTFSVDSKDDCLLPLTRAVFHLISHCGSSLSRLPMCYSTLFHRFLKSVVPPRLDVFDDATLVSFIFSLIPLLSVAYLRDPIANVLEAYVKALCLGDMGSPENLTQRESAWRPCLALLVSSLPSGLGEPYADRYGVHGTEFRLGFWALALDVQLFTPSHIPFHFNRLTLSEEKKPLLLQHEALVLRVLPSLYEESYGGEPCLDSCTEDQAENTARDDVFLTTVCKAIFDWALADLKYEVHVLELATTSYTHPEVPTTHREFPRCSKFMGHMRSFVEKQLKRNSATADIVINFIIRQLADTATLQQLVQFSPCSVDHPLCPLWRNVVHIMDMLQSTASYVLEQMYCRVTAHSRQDTLEASSGANPSTGVVIQKKRNKEDESYSGCGHIAQYTVYSVEQWKPCWLIVEQLTKCLGVLLSGCLSRAVMCNLEHLTQSLMGSRKLDTQHPKELHDALSTDRRAVLSYMTYGLTQDSVCTDLLTSFVFAFEVIMEKFQGQISAYQALHSISEVPPHVTTTRSFFWLPWTTLLCYMLPGIGAQYEATVPHASQPVMGKRLALLETFVSYGWKTVQMVVYDLIHMEQTNHSRNMETIVSFFASKQEYDHIDNTHFDVLVLIFLNEWISRSLMIMESFFPYSLSAMGGKECTHVEAFRSHTRWTNCLVEWCTVLQEKHVRRFCDALRAQRPLQASDATLVWKQWRTTEKAKYIEVLMTAVAKAMTFVHRHFKDKSVEKGSFLIPLLARGDIPPRVTTKLTELCEGSTHTVSSNDTSAPLSPHVNISTPSLECPIFYTSLPKIPCSPKRTSGTLTHLLMMKNTLGTSSNSTSTLKLRSYKPFSSKIRTSGGIAESLLRKLGEERSFPRRHPLHSTRLKPCVKYPALIRDSKKKELKLRTSSVSSATPLLPPCAPSATLGCTVLASSPLVCAGKRETHTKPSGDAPETDKSLSLQCRLSASERALAVEQASVHVQTILNTILEWDVFNLDQLEVPGLQEISKQKVPICFGSLKDFQRAFQPLVLEECRCSLMQSAIERRLEGFPVLITRSTRLGHNTLIATVKSDRIAGDANGNKTASQRGGEASSISDRKLELLSLQPWNLVLLIPTSSTEDECYEGLTFADLKSPPKQGYAIAIVEKDDETETRDAENAHLISARLRLLFRHSTDVAQQLRRISATRVIINSKWVTYTLGSLTTSIREIQSLFMSHLSPLFPFLLNPQSFFDNTQNYTVSADNGSAKELCDNAKERPSGAPLWNGGPTMDQVQALCQLNSFQTQALFYAFTVDHRVALLQGPPGTGKTHTICALLALLYHQEKQNAEKQHGHKTKKILVCAPSNAAIDEIAARILHRGLPAFGNKNAVVHPTCVRIGHPQRITRPEILSISLTENIKREGAKADQNKKSEYFQHREQLAAELDKISAELYSLDSSTEAEAEQFDAASKNGGPGDRALHDLKCKKTALILKKKKMQAHMARIKKVLKEDLKHTKKSWQETTLHQADIVFSTLSGAASECLLGLPIDCVIVDEAAQAVELSTLIPLRLEPLRLVLIGDPQQLPATVLSHTARQLCYERSLFQRLQECGVEIKMLSVQYRMHPCIAAFPSQYFYNNQLINAPTVQNRPPLLCHSWTSIFEPFLFFHVPSQETRCSISQSLSNRDEALFILMLLRLLNKTFKIISSPQQGNSGDKDTSSFTPSSPTRLCWSDISIVTPYKQQVQQLRSLFSSHSLEFPPNMPDVCTIDAFQGREKRVIIFSCVRAGTLPSFSATLSQQGNQQSFSSLHKEKSLHNGNPVNIRSTLGFVADIRRMNVAITRARDSLWIVGNAETLSVNPTWSALIRYAKGCNDKNTTPHRSSFVDILSATKKFHSQLYPKEYPVVTAGSSTTTIITSFFQLVEAVNLKTHRKSTVHPARVSSSSPKSSFNSRSSGVYAMSPATSCDLSSCSSVSSSASDDGRDTHDSRATPTAPPLPRKAFCRTKSTTRKPSFPESGNKSAGTPNDMSFPLVAKKSSVPLRDLPVPCDSSTARLMIPRKRKRNAYTPSAELCVQPLRRPIHKMISKSYSPICRPPLHVASVPAPLKHTASVPTLSHLAASAHHPYPRNMTSPRHGPSRATVNHIPTSTVSFIPPHVSSKKNS